VRRGVQEQFPSIIASSVTTFALVLPFAIMGDVAGLKSRTRWRSRFWAASLP